MNHRYAILGAGRQGVSAAYDIAKFGDAIEVILGDLGFSFAEKGATKLNKILGKSLVKPVSVDVNDPEKLEEVMKEATSVISCVPYDFNLQIMKAAIKTSTNM